VVQAGRGEVGRVGMQQVVALVHIRRGEVRIHRGEGRRVGQGASAVGVAPLGRMPRQLNCEARVLCRLQ
jgi:hypothetical protein